MEPLKITRTVTEERSYAWTDRPRYEKRFVLLGQGSDEVYGLVTDKDAALASARTLKPRVTVIDTDTGEAIYRD